MKKGILCIGEVLWDALPAGLFLGGAPFNVACHLHALGEDVALVSRVGDDVLGREALRRLEERGMSTDLVQVDSSLQTGFVKVALDGNGTPAYEIVEPVAWDALARTDALTARAAQAAAIVFGSLAQREAATRQTVRALCETEALKVFDMNLRPPFINRSIVEASLSMADVVKLNEDELRQMSAWFDLPDAPEAALTTVSSRFNCRVACLTRGSRGGILLRDERCTEHAGYQVKVQDTIGAGDAFLAALLVGLLSGYSDGDLLEVANRLGAYVATVSGGAPAYEITELDAIRHLALDGRKYVGEPN